MLTTCCSHSFPPVFAHTPAPYLVLRATQHNVDQRVSAPWSFAGTCPKEAFSGEAEAATRVLQEALALAYALRDHVARANFINRVQGLLQEPLTDFGRVFAMNERLTQAAEVWRLAHKYHKLSGTFYYTTIVNVVMEEVEAGASSWQAAALKLKPTVVGETRNLLQVRRVCVSRLCVVSVCSADATFRCRISEHVRA